MAEGFAKITRFFFSLLLRVTASERRAGENLFGVENEKHLRNMVMIFKNAKILFHSYRFHYLFSSSSNNSSSPEQWLRFKRKPTKAFRKPVSATFCAYACQGLILCVIQCLFYRILSMI